MKVELEASIVSEGKAQARLGRATGFASAIVDGGARLNLPGRPKPLIINETKFTVEKQ